MLNDALLAEFFHYSVAFQADGAILNIELLKSFKIISHTMKSDVTDHFTALDAKLS